MTAKLTTGDSFIWPLVHYKERHYQPGLAKRLGFLGANGYSSVEPKIAEAEKVLNGLIRSLRDT